jgi:hypothetical protein
MIVVRPPTTVPSVTIVVAPSITAFSRDDPAGPIILLEDVWDESSLAGFDLTIDFNIPHCPILAVQEGYSHAPALSNHVAISILQDVQPLMLPTGQLLGSTVMCRENKHFRAFLLPEVCNLPTGLCWPSTTSESPIMWNRIPQVEFSN